MSQPLQRRVNDQGRQLTRTIAAVSTLASNKPRRITVPLTNIAAGASTVEISWTPPIHRPYLVAITVLCLPANLPLLFAAVVPPSRHAFGATLDVFSTALAPIANASLDVLIQPF